MQVRRWTKITLILSGVLLLLVLAAVFAAHYIMSRQDHQFLRQKLEARFLAATGFVVQVRGPLEVPYSLMPTVVLRDIVLNNPDYAGTSNLLEADELRIQFAVLPLLNGEVVVYESSFSSVDLNLEVSESGDENWISGGPGGASTTLPTQIAVHTVDLHDLSISYRNLQTAVEFQGHIDDIRLRAPLFHDQIEVTIHAEYAETPITVSGKLGSTEDILTGNPFPIDLDVDVFDIDLQISGQLDRMEDGEFSGLLLRLDVQGRDLPELNDLLGVTLPETKQFSATTTLSLEDDAFVASDLLTEMVWRDSELEIAGDIASIADLGGINLTVAASGQDLRDVSAVYDLSWLPRTDAYELSGTLTGTWPLIGAKEARVHLEQDDIVADAAGALGDIGKIRGFDVEATVSGADLRGWTQFAVLPWPQTEAYRVSGWLNGAWPTLSLGAAKAVLQRADLRVDLAGEVGDLSVLSGLDVGIDGSGRDLATVPELLQFGLPATDIFEVDGRIAGTPDALSAHINTASAARGSHTVELSGDIRELVDFRELRLQLQASGGNLAELKEVLGVDLPPTHNYRISAELTGDAQNLAANDVRIEGEMPGATLDFAGSIGRIADLRDVELMMHAATDDMSGLNRYLDFPLPASRAMDISGKLRGSAPNLALDDFTLRSGETLVRGSAAIHMGDRLSIDGSVSAGVLDLYPLLAGYERSGLIEGQESSRLFPEAPVDLSFLDDFDLDLRLDNLELLSSGTIVQVDRATIALNQGSLLIDPLQMTRDEATFVGHFRLQRQAETRYHLDMSIENIPLETFLKDFRVQEIYEGRFDLALELDSTGVSPRQIAANLNGSVAAFVSEARTPQVGVALLKIDLIFELLPWVKRQEEIIVNCAISQVEISDGLAAVNLLYLDGAQMTMIGGGTIDLRDEKLDLRLAPRPKKRRFLAHNIDLTLKGSLKEPALASTGAAKFAATSYGKYALVGPLGLLVPTEFAKKHPCVGSLQEYREQQRESE